MENIDVGLPNIDYSRCYRRFENIDDIDDKIDVSHLY